MTKLKSKRYPEIKKESPPPKSLDGCRGCFWDILAFCVLFMILELPIIELVLWMRPSDLEDEFGGFENFIISLFLNCVITMFLLLFVNNFNKWKFEKRSDNTDILDAD